MPISFIPVYNSCRLKFPTHMSVVSYDVKVEKFCITTFLQIYLSSIFGSGGMGFQWSSHKRPY